MLSSKNLINGEWCESKENDGLKSYNPVNGELVSESSQQLQCNYNKTAIRLQ